MDGKIPIEYSPLMILDERSAAVFINGYQKLLLEICGPAGGNVKLLERLAKGRKKLMSDVSLLDDAVSRLEAPDPPGRRCQQRLQESREVRRLTPHGGHAERRQGAA